MIRFILWSLVFYGIYRLIWPVRRLNQSSTPYDRESDNAAQQAPAGDAKASARSRAAAVEGEYIEYEEIR